MQPDLLPENWLRYADQDYKASITLSDAGLADQAAGHIQQAFEKWLKAALVQFDGTYPKTHDLSRLSSLLLARHPELARFRTEFDELSLLYQMTRYPTLKGFDPNDLPRLLTAAAELQQLTYRILGRTL